ncbi:MAG: amidohydrolase family protein [Promethearchaeota archaeon]
MQLIETLKAKNVKKYTTYNYAHKKGVAEYINYWTHELACTHDGAIPFGCVWPDDENKEEYVQKIFDEWNFHGLKLQLLVQNFYPDDAHMYKIYDMVLDEGKWLCFHAGTASYRNRHVGYKNFIKFLEKYPDINAIVVHMGAFKYKKFLKLSKLVFRYCHDIYSK